ncbi:threonine-phosphate decarboxylase CobD [Methylobacterium sp. NEAU 140]|uniref:threonine-phosphate decarboxylase CobD n=1 Tax=Methylobacterium sp. NEAU 140 TaxID=3064945 RepID=UPI002736678C|nr:threonine-phosphate decarboxylase CobD [Methylobacterium sp. NEAU 140]MDP4024024.1 threonine-phosphate decarboxylase CobD [Methylobacterium sp. NEAU 140]
MHFYSNSVSSLDEIDHGGDLGRIRDAFPDAPEPWIDLSTGINPVPYPLPEIEASAWTRLPAAADGLALRAAAAAAYGAPDPEHVAAAPGTQILIETLPRLVGPARVAVVGPTYAEHAAAWARAGHAVEAVTGIDRVGAAEVAVLVDPNNPDGRTHPLPERRALAEAMRGRGGLLVVDEAFLDFEPVASLCPEVAPGLVVLRSFGKSYGLAGIRLGFAVSDPETVRRLGAALGPWAVSGPALAVGTAALGDRGWRERAARDRAADAARLDRMIVRGGGRVVGGTSLFRTADFPDGPDLHRRLGAAGIAVRRFSDAPKRLRFGLPADRAAWCRLSRVLK